MLPAGGILILKDGTILSVYPDAEETERLLKKHLEWSCDDNNGQRVLYTEGEHPIIRLKYFPKKDCEGKPKWSLICWTVSVELCKSAQASLTTYSSIHRSGVFPVTDFTVVDKCPCVIFRRSA